jgi:hypothetical protein
MKFKEVDDKRVSLEDTANQLRSQVAKLEKELSRVKEENESLKAEQNKNESFFRDTEERYHETSKDSVLQEEVKRLEREKNEFMLALQKEKEKNKK